MNIQPALYASFPVLLAPEDRAAFSMGLMTGTNPNYPMPDNGPVGAALREAGDAVVAGDLSHSLRMLASHTATLDQMYHRLLQLATRAEAEGMMDVYERYMCLAFRAQAQGMRTTLTLGRLSVQHVCASGGAGARDQPAEAVPNEASAAAPEATEPKAENSTAPKAHVKPVNRWRGNRRVARWLAASPKQRIAV